MPQGVDRDEWHPAAIDGELVVLRRHRAENLGAVVRWYRDPELARLTRYQTRPMPLDEIERFFEGRLMAPDALAYAIHIRRSDRLIGVTTFSALDVDNGSALFHITIGEPDAWGRGYGTDAASLMVGHAFRGLGLHRVALSVFSFNARAIRSYEKVGFRIEGRLRDAIWRDGRYWDEVQMGILQADWVAAQERRRREASDETGARRDRAVGLSS